MTKEEEIIEGITEELGKKLSKDFKIAPFYLFNELGETIVSNSTKAYLKGSSTRPDVFVFNEEQNKFTIIEIKGRYPEDDLPLATGTYMNKILEEYEEFNPNLILVTLSGINKNLEEFLNQKNIKVIQFVDKEQAISELITVIEE
jgi:hypothetical protein